MSSEDSTQDSVSSQNMGSVNGGTDENYFAQQGEDSSQSGDMQGGGKLMDDTARDGMYNMQEYYQQMQYGNESGVAMAGLDSDNSNSDSRGFVGAADDPQAQAYAEMMLQMQQQQNQVDEESNDDGGNNTRDSSNSVSQNPESLNGGSDGMMMESTGDHPDSNLDGSDFEAGGATGKRKLEDEESESNNSASMNNIGDASNTSPGSPNGPSPAKKALLEINIRKLLPDLEKHWKPVEDDPNDFQAWTYLLQYVDQEVRMLIIIFYRY